MNDTTLCCVFYYYLKLYTYRDIVLISRKLLEKNKMGMYGEMNLEPMFKMGQDLALERGRRMLERAKAPLRPLYLESLKTDYQELLEFAVDNEERNAPKERVESLLARAYAALKKEEDKKKQE